MEKQSEKSSIWLVSFLVKAITDIYVVYLVSFLGSKAG